MVLTISGTATSSSDCVALPTSVVIPAGATSYSLYVQPLDDTTAEASETVIVTVAANAAYTVGSPNAGTVTILDDEPTIVSVAATKATASESAATQGLFTVTRTGSLTAALNVATTITGTATNGTDYTAIPTGVVLPAGVNSTVVGVTPLEDGIVEPNETVILTVVAGSGYTVGTAAATVTIQDNEAPVVQIVATDATAAEPGTDTGTFTVSRTGLLTAALTIPLTVSGTATSGTDFTALPATLTLAANAASGTIVVTPLDDSVPEVPETVIVTLGAGSGFTIGAAGSATVTINDNEPTIAVVATDAVAFEPNTNTGTFTITRTGATTAALSVPYTLSGTATSGSDFVALSGTATIAAAATSTTVVVTPIDDAIAESPESVILTLTPNAAYAITATSATVLIGDNDPLPATVTIAATTANAQEPSTSGLFTVTRTGATTSALTVPLTITGTATAGVDYTALPATVTIPSGSATTTLSVTPIDDATAEATETVIATIATSAYLVVGSPSSATVNLLDDETPVVTVAATDASASEPGLSAGTGTFTVTRTGSRTAALTVSVAVSGTATAGSDYTALPVSVTIPAASATATLTVTPLDDAIAEPDETVILTLTTGAGYTLGTTTTATVTIADDETPVVFVSVTDALCSEVALNPGAFAVNRFGNKTAALTIPLSTSGTATSGSDYTPLPASVTLAANAISAAVALTPLADSTVEGDETVKLTLGTGAGYTVGAPSQDTITLIDAAPVYTVQVLDAAAACPGDPGLLAVLRSGDVSATGSVTITLSGTAVNGTDYRTIATTVSFAAASSRTVIPIVPALATPAWSGSRTATITLATGAGYTVGAANAGTVTIQANQPPQVVVVNPSIVAGTPTTLFLDASGTTDPNGNALTYQWSIYGIGVIGTAPTLTYSFAGAGRYDLQLAVSDGLATVTTAIPIDHLTTATTFLDGNTLDDGGVLIVDNAIVSVNGAHAYRGVHVINGGTLTHDAGTLTVVSKLDLTLSGGVLFIDAASRIDVKGKGCPAGTTWDGTAITATGGTTGTASGSHGGYGTPSGYDPQCEVYGSYLDPNEPGAGGYGGGYGSIGNNSGIGGGIVRISAGTLANNGAIMADGIGGNSGGGAGGSIAITTATWSGSGTLSAKGGLGGSSSGGGGRIALTYTTGTVDTTKLSAAGGANGSITGGAGSIYVKQSAASSGTVLFDNGGSLPLSPPTPWWHGVRATSDDPTTWTGQLIVKGGAGITTEGSPTTAILTTGSLIDNAKAYLSVVQAQSLTISTQSLVELRSLTALSLTLSGTSVLQSPIATVGSVERLLITITNALTIDATSRIDVKGRGCPAGTTWDGAVITATGGTTGTASGSHGGYGSPSGADPQCEVYGSYLDPNEPGAGGYGTGYTSNGTNSGYGGGIARISTGTLANSGTIVADGVGGNSGGGAGGSIAITTATWSGSGTLSAKGGIGGYSSGGGGRIAITYTTGTVDSTKLSAIGGLNGSVTGGAGSIYLKQSSASSGAVLFDNSGTASFAPPTPWWHGARATSDDPATWTGQLIVKGGAAITTEGSPTTAILTTGSLFDNAKAYLRAVQAQNLTISTQSLVELRSLTALSLTLSGTSVLQSPIPAVGSVERLLITTTNVLTIDATSRIDVKGRGCPPGTTWDGTTITTTGGTTGTASGSHGGYAWTSGSDPQCEVYGSLSDPSEPGAGGYGTNYVANGLGFGGGVVRISAGTLANSGAIVADGTGGNSGAGAGGSIAITTTTWSSSGTLSAKGALGGYSSSGGGRIAVIYTTGTVDPAKLSAVGGANGSLVGGPGTILIDRTGTRFGVVIIDNGGNPTAVPATPLFFGGLHPTTYPAKCPVDFTLQVVAPAAVTFVGDQSAFDYDNDQLRGWEEAANGTDPRNWDTNGNGLSDGNDLALGNDPNDLDSDHDGLTNAQERLAGTNPLSADTDRDGVPDNLDTFPNDPTASSWPAPPPVDTTPPVITIDSPANTIRL